MSGCYVNHMMRIICELCTCEQNIIIIIFFCIDLALLRKKRIFTVLNKEILIQ